MMIIAQNADKLTPREIQWHAKLDGGRADELLRRRELHA